MDNWWARWKTFRGDHENLVGISENSIGSATYLAALQEIIGSEAVTNVYAASYFHDKTTHELSSRLICFSKKLEEMFLARREFNKSVPTERKFK